MRSLTNDVISKNAVAILHLFELDINELDGTFKETVLFTDHDIYVIKDGKEYTPLSITFDKLTEDITLTASTVTIQVDNVNKELSTLALDYEWRRNRVLIERVVYTPPTEIVNGDEYKYGIGDNLDGYPKLKLDDIIEKTTYSLFTGVVDVFSASESAISITASTQFASWGKTFPTRTYNQNEYASVVDAIKNLIYWGIKK